MDYEEPRVIRIYIGTNLIRIRYMRLIHHEHVQLREKFETRCEAVWCP